MYLSAAFDNIAKYKLKAIGSLLAGLSIFWLATACVPTRHLGPNENLLYSVQLKGVTANDPAKIATFYQQKPNRKFLGSTPYLWLYYLGRQFYDPARIQKQIEQYRTKSDRRLAAAGADSAKIRSLLAKRAKRLAALTEKQESGNWLMTLGEPPVIYDSTKTPVTQDQIKTYLNTKGFFHSAIAHTAVTQDKKVYLTLDVQEGRPTKITQVKYNIPDPALAQLVDSAQSGALLQPRQNYDEEIIDAERNRLELLLRNQGYYEFRKPFITAQVDTSLAPYSAHFTFLIANNKENQPHKRYRLRTVNFLADAHLNRFGSKRDTIRYGQVNYLAYQHAINPRVLDSKLTLAPRQEYSLDRTLSTQRQLNDLDMFRFNSVTYRVVADSTSSSPQPPQLDAYVNVSPTKKYQETSEAGGSYTARLPGPFVNLRFKVRNIFGGAEILDIGLRGGLEGQFSSLAFTESIYMKDFGGNVGLTFPEFLVPFPVAKHVSRYNPRSRFNVAYTFVSRQEYTRTNLETTFDYIWQPTPNVQYVVTPLAISLIKTPFVSPEFDSLLNRNTTYGQSFTNALVPSLNFTRFYNNFRNTHSGQYWRLFAEVGGVSMLLAEQINQGAELDSVGRLRVYKFYKINSDYRRYLKVASHSFLVYRVNLGLTRPFRSVGLPYDKYFFCGRRHQRPGVAAAPVGAGGLLRPAAQPGRRGQSGYSPRLRHRAARRIAAGNKPGIPL